MDYRVITTEFSFRSQSLSDHFQGMKGIVVRSSNKWFRTMPLCLTFSAAGRFGSFEVSERGKGRHMASVGDRNMNVYKDTSRLLLACIIWMLLFDNAMATNGYKCVHCWSTAIADSAGLLPTGSDDDLFIQYTNVIWRSRQYYTCRHSWEEYTSAAHMTPILCPVVLLFNKEDKYGAVLLESNNRHGVKYRWWYRTDGSSIFDDTSNNLHEGEGFRHHGDKSFPGVRFGPFELTWSNHDGRYLYVYYTCYAIQPPPPGATRICVTDLQSIKGVDAKADKWKYKQNPLK